MSSRRRKKTPSLITDLPYECFGEITNYLVKENEWIGRRQKKLSTPLCILLSGRYFRNVMFNRLIVSFTHYLFRIPGEKHAQSVKENSPFVHRLEIGTDGRYRARFGKEKNVGVKELSSLESIINLLEKFPRLSNLTVRINDPKFNFKNVIEEQKYNMRLKIRKLKIYVSEGLSLPVLVGRTLQRGSQWRNGSDHGQNAVLEMFPNISSLKVLDSYRGVFKEKISYDFLSNLKKLDVTSCCIFWENVLQYLPQLEELNARFQIPKDETTTFDPKVFRFVSNLRILNISCAPLEINENHEHKILDVCDDIFPFLTKLEVLKTGGSYLRKDDIFSNLQNVKFLEVSYCQNLNGSFVNYLPQLEKLIANGIEQMKEIGNFEKLKNLKFVSCLGSIHLYKYLRDDFLVTYSDFMVRCCICYCDECIYSDLFNSYELFEEKGCVHPVSQLKLFKHNRYCGICSSQIAGCSQGYDGVNKCLCGKCGATVCRSCNIAWHGSGENFRQYKSCELCSGQQYSRNSTSNFCKNCAIECNRCVYHFACEKCFYTASCRCCGKIFGDHKSNKRNQEKIEKKECGKCFNLKDYCKDSSPKVINRNTLCKECIGKYNLRVVGTE